MRRRIALRASWPGLAALLAGAGCSTPAVEPLTPTWADVAPIFRGECNGCHGWTAGKTGGEYRFDFFDVTHEVCGNAALALAVDPNTILAGSAAVAKQIQADVVVHGDQQWARMPPQPSPALPDWERDTIERWAAQPVKGVRQENQPPTLQLSGLPAAADGTVTFTAVLDDPDGDAALGVIEVNGLAFLMNRTGSFDVKFDSSAWPAGGAEVSAVICDGWTRAEYPGLANVQISHPAAKTP